MPLLSSSLEISLFLSFKFAERRLLERRGLLELEEKIKSHNKMETGK